MKPGNADRVRILAFFLFVFLLATVPAYCQRGTFDLNVGQTSDRFGSLAPVTSAVIDINGELVILKPSAKNGGPSVVAGGEVRAPADTSNHSKEYAVYGGVAWAIHSLSIGVNGEVRKILIPPATVDNQILNRYNMNLLEVPIVIKYRFGNGKRAFVEAQGWPEFTPHYKTSAPVQTPKPNFDHGYTLRGTVGCNFGKWWYVQGTYESRYMSFMNNNGGNPSGLYNWKSNMITGGAGIHF
jgi:hypothetical protein